MFRGMSLTISRCISIVFLLTVGVVSLPAQAGFFDNLLQGGGASRSEGFRLSKKDAADYEAAGNWWGSRHRTMMMKAGDHSDEYFTRALADSDTPEGLGYFGVHSDLKESFMKGYRLGYQDRTADLVLGPYLTDAAALIGANNAKQFVEVVEKFEGSWGAQLRIAVDVFVTLISEGSQADREKFIRSFETPYDAKYQKSQEDLRRGGCVEQISEGGTSMCLDARKTVAVLDIPSTTKLKTEIYHQTFKVMGDEWGKRFSHNLIRREELIDLLRRSKTAFNEVWPKLDGNLALVRSAFIASYGDDADNVFDGLVKDAGYKTPVGSR